MPQARPARLQHIAGIGVDQMGAIADASRDDFLRLENLDTDIPPDPAAAERTRRAATNDSDNSYLPFVGQSRLREIAAQHVSRLSGVSYSGERNCIISAGGLSGILNVLLATVEVGDEVIVTDPTYVGLLNRIRLVGGVPKFVPFTFNPGGLWQLDLAALRAAIGPKVTTMLLMSPSMPCGGYLTANDWSVVAELCCAHDITLILNTAMERLLFDDRAVVHPAGLTGMAQRTITVGSCAKELRMIGWRVGWIIAPERFMPDLVAVSLANVVVPVGIAQDAVATALENSELGLAPYIRELQTRRDVMAGELEGLPFGLPAGGWSMLLRTSDFRIDGAILSARLLEQNICATTMSGWGDTHGAQYIRFVFSNEPASRLSGLGRRVRVALSQTSGVRGEDA